MKARFVALVAALLIAVPAMAQDQAGTIEGIVKDSSGGVIPGVTIEAKAASGTRSTVSDQAGIYRFPSLPPGRYEIIATLQGFRPAIISNLDLRLGQILKADVTLALEGVTETVQVSAERPIIDVKQSERATNVSGEQIELLPKGRDFTSLIIRAPGVNTESRLGGLSVDGASAGENRWIVDGIETTNLETGLSSKNVIVEFIDEVQVKSSGYAAEFGGALGGVVNVITKSGTNNWDGYAVFNFEHDALSGGRRPTLRLNPSNSSIAEFVTYADDSRVRMEPGFGIGGPILRDRAWFFAGYQPAFTTVERTVDLRAGGTVTEDQVSQVQYLTANITSQLLNELRGRVAYNNSWSRTEGLLPALTGTDPAGTDYSKTQTFPDYSVSGNLDWVATPNLFIGVRGGYYFQDVYDSNVPTETRYTFQNTNIGLAGVPESLQRATGFSSIPSNSRIDRDQQTRLYGQADATLYGNLGGQHQLKFGVQLDRIGNNVLSGESANWVRISWNRQLASGNPLQRGPFGYYQVRSNGVDPEKGFITEGDIHSNLIGLFIQDQWTINNRLTINAGVRTERERVPTYTVGEDIPEFGLQFDFADKLAPRIGVAYDVNGDGRWKAFGNYGVFYDNFKLELPRGSFGGDKWLEYYYTLDTPDWTSLDVAGCPPACPGTLIRGPIDFRHPSFGSDSIDPDLEPMRMTEYAAGVEHQLNDVISLSARYVHKQIDQAIEDTGAQDADGNEIYIVANPGSGLAALAWPGVPLPKPVRDYDSVEFVFDKRFQDNWSLRTSYLWSRLDGNYSGLSQSDESGRTSPNVGRLWDHPLMMFGADGKPVLGRLATDRPHQFKAQFIYAFSWGTSVGINQYASSGVPVSREARVLPGSNYPMNYAGRLTDGRTDTFLQTDLQVAHEFRVGSNALQVSLNVLNLFNQDAAEGKHQTMFQSGAVSFTEADFFAGNVDFDAEIASQVASGAIVLDPRFLMDNSFQAPIAARLGVKFIF